MLSQPFDRSETPPPPTLPVKSKMKKDVRLVSEEMPAIVDHFTVDEELEDDWFGEDNADLPANLSGYKNNESDDEGPGNPMVAGDEDVEPVVEYYSKQNSVLQIHPKDDDEDTQSYEDAEDIQEDVAPVVEQYRPPIFKSELDDVWSRSLRRLSGPEIISDSEDEDNRQPTAIDSPYLESPSFNFGGSGEGYEEIGGSSENPWSTGQNNEQKEAKEVRHSWGETRNDDNVSVLLLSSNNY